MAHCLSRKRKVKSATALYIESLVRQFQANVLSVYHIRHSNDSQVRGDSRAENISETPHENNTKLCGSFN